MKLILEGLTLSTEGCAVKLTSGSRITTSKENPSAQDVVDALCQFQGYYPNKTQKQACSRAAEAARRNFES